jgi:repressor LexA
MSRPNYKKGFPGRLTTARRRLDLSLKQLGDMVGVSLQTIQRWEKDERKPERISAQRLAEVLQDDLGEPWLSQYATSRLQTIPVVAKVAAGRPIDFEVEDETITVDPEFIHTYGDICALRVTGESMVEHHILDKDVLICRRTPEPRNGSIVVVDFREGIGASVKFWTRKGDVVRLASERHPQGDSEQFEFSAAKLGKVYEVVGLVRSLR